MRVPRPLHSSFAVIWLGYIYLDCCRLDSHFVKDQTPKMVYWDAVPAENMVDHPTSMTRTKLFVRGAGTRGSQECLLPLCMLLLHLLALLYRGHCQCRDALQEAPSAGWRAWRWCVARVARQLMTQGFDKPSWWEINLITDTARLFLSLIHPQSP